MPHILKGKTRGPIPNQPEFAHKMDTCGLGFKVIIFSWSKTKLSKYSWNESGEEWRSFKGHSVRSSAKDGEHRSQVRRRGRLLLFQVVPMPPPPVDVPTLILMWWLKKPYMMLCLLQRQQTKHKLFMCSLFLKSPWRAPGSSPVFDSCGMAGGTPAAGNIILIFCIWTSTLGAKIENDPIDRVWLTNFATKGGYGAVYKSTPHAKQGDLFNKLFREIIIIRIIEKWSNNNVFQVISAASCPRRSPL